MLLQKHVEHNSYIFIRLLSSDRWNRNLTTLFYTTEGEIFFIGLSHGWFLFSCPYNGLAQPGIG